MICALPASGSGGAGLFPMAGPPSSSRRPGLSGPPPIGDGSCRCAARHQPPHSSQAFVALQHHQFAGMVRAIFDGVIDIMIASWKTKYGNRRIKQALPTIEEALTAAECMSSDAEQQVEIAATLLGVDVEEVREVARKMKKQGERRLTLSISPSIASDRRMPP